jgi:hypothetical protein
MNDPRTNELIAEDHQRSQQYATKGTIKQFMLSLGFFPHDEEDAKKLIKGIISENEELRRRLR